MQLAILHSFKMFTRADHSIQHSGRNSSTSSPNAAWLGPRRTAKSDRYPGRCFGLKELAANVGATDGHMPRQQDGHGWVYAGGLLDAYSEVRKFFVARLLILLDLG